MKSFAFLVFFVLPLIVGMVGGQVYSSPVGDLPVFVGPWPICGAVIGGILMIIEVVDRHLTKKSFKETIIFRYGTIIFGGILIFSIFIDGSLSFFNEYFDNSLSFEKKCTVRYVSVGRGPDYIRFKDCESVRLKGFDEKLFYKGRRVTLKLREGAFGKKWVEAFILKLENDPSL